MYEGNPLELRMKKMIVSGEKMETAPFHCQIIRYDKEEERIYMVLVDAKLPEVSLDAVYECVIAARGQLLSCDGRIRERYYNHYGKVLVLQVENGFFDMAE